MISKEEAEEKLLKIFYDSKLDNCFKKNPTKANIQDFEETKDPAEFDHWYDIKDDELKIGMWANNYENGINYVAVQMAFDSARMWKGDFLTKHINTFSCLSLIIPLMTVLFGRLIKVYSPIAAIIINIIGTGVLIYFMMLTFKWKKNLLVRFKEFYEDTGIILSEETFKIYSKSPLNTFVITYLFQCLIVFLIFLSWVMGISKGV